MAEIFYCAMCDVTFSSWKEMKDHFQSEEHKSVSATGRADILIDRFVKKFKELCNEHGDNRPNKI